MNKRKPDWPFVSFWNLKPLYLLTFIRFHLLHHALSFAVTHGHFLFLVVIWYHSLSLVALVVAIRCHSLYHSLSFVVPLVVPLVVTRCNTHMSFHKRFFKIGVLTNFAIFTERHLFLSLYLLKGLSTLLKVDSNTGVFLWILLNF